MLLPIATPIKTTAAAAGGKSVEANQPCNANSWNSYLLNEDILQVNCNSIVGDLHKKKFGSGSKGKCIYVNSMNGDVDGDRKWLTPIEFEHHCGKANCKDWKRSIKCGGQPLIKLIDDNILTCHALSCSCAICSNDNTVIGPIRPFARTRRRKQQEIQAQNAFKKFLSLKPPTFFVLRDLNQPH